MAYALNFDAEGERFYEVGTKHGVIYPWDTTQQGYGQGVAWNGLTGVTESPSGGDETSFWADDMKYFTRRGNEEFGLSIKAFYYPDEFAECDGTAKLAKGVRIRQQTRKRFAFTWETTRGNDTEGDAYGSVIHIAYGVTASPSSKDNSTINDSADVSDFTWECSTTPVTYPGYKPTSVIDIDISDYKDAETDTDGFDAAVEWLLETLYGKSDIPEFSATATYAKGDLVVHGGSGMEAVYEAKAAISEAAAWNSDDWLKIADGTAVPARVPSISEVADHFPAVAAG